MLLRQARQVTRVSLFAFISKLCRNRQVTGSGVGRAETGGRSDGEGATAATAAVEPAGQEITAQVSLAVAAKAAAENFPVALRVLPKRWRAHLTALYGFARLVDDIGDEPLPGLPSGTPAETVTATRLRLLDELEQDVRRIYTPGAPEPELRAIRDLKRTVNDCAVPAQPLYDLIQANRQDQLVARYETYAELEDYCRLSANPVGQVVLAIVGSATPERIVASDKVCTALQVIEHCQDVAEDLGNDRVYLPRQDMAAHGVTEADLARPTAGKNVRDLLMFEADRAAALLNEGAPLVGTLNGMARLAIAGYVAGGRATLKAMERGGYDVLRNTPRPGKRDTLAMMASCYVKGR
jgi:squalene synthase HpnC